ncbi:MAG: response regulator [Lachnospiraceae bacterium]|nr:response regulator [Lachnospiraceae bacterium]
MSLKDILFIIQYITIFGSFAEALIILRSWKSRAHIYLFLSSLALFINSLGYLFEMKAETPEAFITALKLSYSGRIWLVFLLFMFAVDLSRVRVPDILRDFLVLFHIVSYVVILTFEKHGLYYKNYSFETGGIFIRFIRENGVWHHLLVAFQAVYMAVGFSVLLSARRKEKNPATKRRLTAVFIALFTEGVCYVIQTAHVVKTMQIYDFTMPGFFVGTIIMLIAILSYDLLGAGEIAREYMIDRISEGIIAVDRYGTVQYFNEPAKELFPELGNGAATVPVPISQAVLNGESLMVNERIYTPETNELVHNGESYGRLFALVDETDHIRYMEELEKQKEAADSANEAKSRFLANMSHEIRTPINAVLGMDEMILRESGEEAVRSYAADIMSAGRTLVSLVNDILDLSKVEEGKMEIIPVQYDLSVLINDLSNMIRDRAVKKGLKFYVEVDEAIPHLLIGDEIRIKQCALNILSNAVKYTEEGFVRMKFSYEKKPPLKDEGEDRHIILCFLVEDTGIGMHKEDMETLFSPYERLEERRNRTIEGTGLGMSITRQLLSLMGSDLSVESEYGKGSVLSFRVEQEVVRWDAIGDCLLRTDEIKGVDGYYHELFHAPDARILVVDDTEINLTVINSLLKRTQIQIDTAMSGRDALTLAKVNPYDVIFIDHMMPDMDGIETLKRLREMEGEKKTPAVALTANAVSGSRRRYIDAGFTDYLAKPIDGRKLERLLKRLLPEEKLETAVRVDEIPAEAGPSNAPPGKSKILVVDDDEPVIALVKNIMEPLYEIKGCLLGGEALRTAKEFSPDLIMLDIHLSDGNGFAVMEVFKNDEMTMGIPVLLITGDDDIETEENGFKSGASDYIRKPFAPEVLKQRAKRIIELSRYQRSIEKEVERQTARSRRLSKEMMFTLSKTVDTKDHYTNGHSRRVAAYSAEIARRLGKTGDEQVELYEIGLLHDIGKIGVHEDIIHKDSKLTDDEFFEIKEHTVNGYEILREIADMPRLCEGARWHHERFGGGGYPDGLNGEEIPESARIVCVADCYDAMTSTRTYSKPKTQSEVRAEIERCKGSIFDPVIADVMLSMIDEDKEYRMNEQITESPGEVWKGYGRLWKNSVIIETGRTGDNKEGKEAAGLPDWLSKLQGLDVNGGIKNCGSCDGYLSVLTVFHQTAKAKAEEIESLYRAFTEAEPQITDNKDDGEDKYGSDDKDSKIATDEKDRRESLTEYTIRVHALKSSAKIIGAGDLSKLAEKLEDAGKREDTGFIRENTGKLLSMYRTLDNELCALDIPEGELREMTAESMKEAYRTIYEIAQSMDYGLMEDILKDLKNYSLSGRDKAVIGNIEKCLTELDWEGISVEADRAVKRE